MAEPLREDHPLSEMRFPEKSEPISGFVPPRSGPGPVPVEPLDTTTAVDRQLPEQAHDQPIGEWPYERERDRDSGRRYQTTAESLGTVLATAKDRARDFAEIARDRARDLAGVMQDRMQDLKSRLRVVGGRASDQARDRAEDLKDTTVRQARIARNRAQYIAHEYPLEFIAGAAAAGFVIGFMLRIFRED